MISGKLRGFVISQACRIADRIAENKPCRAFEVALMEAANRKVARELKAKYEPADMSALGDCSHPMNALGGMA